MNNNSFKTMNKRKVQSLYKPVAHDDLLAWLDTIPLSRPIDQLGMEFADGLLVAEIIEYYFPEEVDLDSSFLRSELFYSRQKKLNHG